jgi:hypothetical protein
MKEKPGAGRGIPPSRAGGKTVPRPNGPFSRNSVFCLSFAG